MKKILLTESEKKALISEREKAIITNFTKTFNSIKIVDENELKGQNIRKFDPEYKLTYAEDNNLEKTKTDIIQDAMQHIKHVSDYFGSDKADELIY